MKSPPIQIHDDIARERVEAFIAGTDVEVLHGDEPAQPKRPTRKLSSPKRRASAGRAG